MSTPSASEAPAIGFVGLGMMGAPIAERLRAGGHPLIVYNRTREKAEPLLAAGARWAFTPKDVGRTANSRIVFTILSDARALERVLFGRNGLARGLARGALVVDLTTISPNQSRSFAERLAPNGIHFVDAPLGGNVDAARNGRLLVFVGGSDEDVARARPLLERIGRRVEHLGPVGAGTSMKLVNNLFTLGYGALAAEGLAFAEGLGLDRRRTIDLLLDGRGYSRVLEQKRIAFEERRYPTQFFLRWAEKDLKLITHSAHLVDRDVPMTHEAERLANEGVRAGLGSQDWAAILETALARRWRPAVPAAPPPAETPPASETPGT